MQEGEDEFANEFIAKAIQANSSYEGYPVGTSMTRQLIARRVALFALENGCDGICEGSTGKGNDQYRMHNVFSLFAPDLTVVVPVRDFNFTRAEEKVLSKQYGIPYREGIGDDRNMWSRSIGSGEVDNLKMRLKKEDYLWWVPPEDAPDKPTTISIEFKEGIPVSCNGKTRLSDIIQYLNKVGGANSIGKIDMMEDGMMGLKSREAYEAPGATIILKLHKDLEQLCLTKEEVYFKPIIDAKWAELVYCAAWFHPLKTDLDGFIARSQRFVNGKYEVELLKGNIDIVSRDSASGLFNPEIRSLATKGFDQRDAGPAVKIHGIPYHILGKRGL
jgi:argininosuccinate synthase